MVFPVKITNIKKRKKKDFIESVENNTEILDEKSDEKRRVNKTLITTRSYPRQQEKNQVIIFIIFRGL